VVLTLVSLPTSLDSRWASTRSWLPRLSRSEAASTSWARLWPTSRACRKGSGQSGLPGLHSVARIAAGTATPGYIRNTSCASAGHLEPDSVSCVCLLASSTPRSLWGYRCTDLLRLLPSDS
jgi:hypothetical protein